ncbi:type II secretion system major pseudopilin GspG [Aureimonas ureilytica]|uniref:type II secretion system major pseudopilin GspG n=1 Tax=Aureimonas ureilytica TaxID=401562 RepID=UPI003CE8239B
MLSFRNRAVETEASDEGFTLVELLVVLAIIALIGTLVGPRVLGYIGTAKADTAKTQLQNLANAVELYYLDTGAYPAADKGLAALTASDGAPGWNGPYLKSATGLQDPWGRAYRYEAAPGGFRIATLGRDGTEGGTGEDADLTNR